MRVIAASTAATSAPGVRRTASVDGGLGYAAQQRRRGDVRDAAVVLERADDPRHAQAQLAARWQRQGQRRADAQPERLRQPVPDLGLMRSAVAGGR